MCIAGLFLFGGQVVVAEGWEPDGLGMGEDGFEGFKRDVVAGTVLADAVSVEDDDFALSFGAVEGFVDLFDVVGAFLGAGIVDTRADEAGGFHDFVGSIENFIECKNGGAFGKTCTAAKVREGFGEECVRFNVALGAGVGEECGRESGFGHGLDSRGDFDLEVFFCTDFSNGIDGFSVRDAMAANRVTGFIEHV